MFKRQYYAMGAAFTAGLLSNTSSALAAPATPGGAGKSNFSSIAETMATSVSSIPGLISAIAYLFGVLIAVLGILKIKDHVENPTQTPLKDGAIRLAAGGALFALPIVMEAMLNTIGQGGDVNVAKVNKVSLGLTGTP